MEMIFHMRFLATLFLTACGLFADSASNNRLVTYSAPEGVSLNPRFTVKVHAPGEAWRDVPVYIVKVDAVRGVQHTPLDSSMCYFDFAGTVEVSVTLHADAIRSARIRPLSYNIQPAVQGSTLTFSLSQPRNVSVEVNGDIFANLHLFSNPIENERPDPNDPRVLYYGPGLHTIPGNRLLVPSGKTVYIAGGAVVRGQIVCNGVSDVRVLGRGIIDQPRGSLRIANSARVEVDGVIGSQFFTGGSRNVTIRNVKCISYVGNGDGMNVISSQDVLIDGVFNRNSDDCITVYATRLGFTGGSRGVTVQNSTLWADVAHPILVGTHGNTPNPETIEDLVFSNLDILDHMEPQIDYQGTMALDAGDSNLIRNVRFENIRVEDFRRGQLVNIRVFYNRKYCTSPGRGIENVYFKNVTYSGSHAEISVIAGYDDARMVRNLVFENLVINGTLIWDKMPKPAWYKTSDMARFFVGEHVDGLEFRKTSEASGN